MKDVKAQGLSFKEKINCTHLGKKSPLEIGITVRVIRCLVTFCLQTLDHFLLF
jgi:hypothetical protein